MIDKLIAAMVCITAIEIVALTQGVNGLSVSIVIALLAAMGGYTVAKVEEQYGNIIDNFKLKVKK